MLAEIELIIQPYSSQAGNSVLDILISQLNSNEWTRFLAAVAFLRRSGNFLKLIDAMEQFMNNGGEISITAGADTFGGNARGTDFEAVHFLLTKFDQEPKFALHLYHEQARTFHPKLYLFSNEHANRAFLIIGSSNWSYGGLFDNIEANVTIKLNLDNEQHKQIYQTILEHFQNYWTEIE